MIIFINNNFDIYNILRIKDLSEIKFFANSIICNNEQL